MADNERNNCKIEKTLTDEEFKKAFFSLEMYKSPGYDDISFNVVKDIFEHICTTLKHIFKQSLLKGLFPDSLKISRVTPLFKTGEQARLCNYRHISVLPSFP